MDGLNRSDSLYSSDYALANAAQAGHLRLGALEKAKTGGSVHVTCSLNKKAERDNYRISMFQAEFSIRNNVGDI